MSENKNLELWNRLRSVDKDFTKPMPGKSKLTSIDAQWRFMRMTETFGPYGKGWGAEFGQPFFHRVECDPNENPAGYIECVYVSCSIWYWLDGERCQTGFHTGGTVVTRYDKYDNLMNLDDLIKSTETDAMCKAMSIIGVAADVYLGSFDADKYQSTHVTRTEPRQRPAPQQDQPARQAPPQPQRTQQSAPRQRPTGNSQDYAVALSRIDPYRAMSKDFPQFFGGDWRAHRVHFGKAGGAMKGYPLSEISDNARKWLDSEWRAEIEQKKANGNRVWWTEEALLEALDSMNDDLFANQDQQREEDVMQDSPVDYDVPGQTNAEDIPF